MIELFDGYKIDVDDYSYALMRETGSVRKDTGKPKNVVIGYYGSLSAALIALKGELVRQKLKNASVRLSEAVDAIKESNERVERLIESEIGKNE